VVTSERRHVGERLSAGEGWPSALADPQRNRVQKTPGEAEGRGAVHLLRATPCRRALRRMRGRPGGAEARAVQARGRSHGPHGQAIPQKGGRMKQHRHTRTRLRLLMRFCHREPRHHRRKRSRAA
jgi:hypothetical protein